MKTKQRKDLEKHHNRINEDGESLIKGSMLWIIMEALENIHRIEDLLGPKYDRPSKKDIKPVLRDLRDQLVELKGRLG